MNLPDAATLRRWREQPQVFVREVFGVEPDPWQDEVLADFPTCQRQAMQAPIAVDETVYTPSGPRRWGHIRPGDTVFAADGRPTKVRRRFDVGRVPLFRVSFSDGTSVVTSADHQWRVQTQDDRKKRRWRILTTKELAERPLKRARQRLICIPSQGPADFLEADLPLAPYVLGLWLGDGVRNESSLVCPDPAIRDEIANRGFVFRERRRGDQKNITLYGMRGAWGATGVHALYSHEKYIPHDYKFASVEQRFDLLRGLMDSDGTVTRNGQTYYATSSSILANDVVWLARSLGYLSWRSGPYQISGGERRDAWRTTLSGPICPFAADTMKKRRWREPLPHKYTRFIDEIVPTGEGEAMCISVAHPSECFLIGDFIVTHNCKGPGKTSVLAWLNWNFLVTRPHPKLAGTSVTRDNLRDNLWAEMAKWQQRSELLKSEFVWSAGRIFHKPYPETWFMSARAWAKSSTAEEQEATLAGLHADYIMFTLDESGGIPDSVMAAADAALSSPIEGHILQAGNPLMLSGPLYRAATADRALWKLYEITADPDDPKRTPRVKIEWALEQIKKYGRDNPWVLVNVFGRFPPASINTLIGPDDVSEAMKRVYRESDIVHAARILGVDVARFGDDASVIFPRRGLVALAPQLYRNLDSQQGAGLVAAKWQEWDADAVFIDDTGGYGAGWIDALRALGHQPIGVQFAGRPNDTRYYNKRAEMYFALAEWIKHGGMLPPVPELTAALTQMTFSYVGDRLLLEDKGQLKARIGFSPDHADALAMTFAQPVARRQRSLFPVRRGPEAPWTPREALREREMVLH